VIKTFTFCPDLKIGAFFWTQQMEDVTTDRVADVVVVGSAAAVLTNIESVALIFSLLAGGTYYTIKAIQALKNK
jgi:hypothetical protein